MAPMLGTSIQVLIIIITLIIIIIIAVFKWLSKVITLLQLLRLVTGLKILRHGPVV